jgi:circadian clock protein KaiB
LAKRKTKVRSRSSTAEYERLYDRAQKEKCILRLYVTGITSRSTQAIASIRTFCDEYLPGRYDLEVIDIYQQPAEAIVGQIIAAPTLIKEWPAPVRKIIGNISDPERVMKGLGLRRNPRPGQAGRQRKDGVES